MRLLLQLAPKENIAYEQIHSYLFQSFIYSLLKRTDFEFLHASKSFKYFCFSNFFPISDFKENEPKNVLISSPNRDFLQVVYKQLKELKDQKIRLGAHSFSVKNVKKLKVKLRFPWETATPIVLNKEKIAKVKYSTGFTEEVKIPLENAREIISQIKRRVNAEVKIADVYFSFRRGDNLASWLEILRRNSLAKYNSYFNTDFELSEPLFDNLHFRKEVSIKVRIKSRGDVIYIGSHWKSLSVLRKLDREERKFYSFLMDCGLGRLNSLGFGFVNPRQSHEKF